MAGYVSNDDRQVPLAGGYVQGSGYVQGEGKGMSGGGYVQGDGYVQG